jgi:hypothetical protein
MTYRAILSHDNITAEGYGKTDHEAVTAAQEAAPEALKKASRYAVWLTVWRCYSNGHVYTYGSTLGQYDTDTL